MKLRETLAPSGLMGPKGSDLLSKHLILTVQDFDLLFRIFSKYFWGIPPSGGF